MIKSDKSGKRLKFKMKGSGAKNKAGESANIVNRNIGDRMRARKDLRARRRADQKARMPKNPIKRFAYYLKPKNFAAYWFNRDGAIRALKVAGIGLAVMMVFMLAVFAYFRKDLPRNITNLDACSQGASTLYYDNTGQTLLWASSGDVECYPVKLENINNNLQKAVIAIEDKDFYTHGGFSAEGVTRAFINNLRGESTQGGSTITQQFVKNSLLSQEQTYTRKIKEVMLSFRMEKNLTKEAILYLYLNQIYLGQGAYGIGAASDIYFRKPVSELTIPEMALLAGLPQAPSRYSPIYNPKSAKERQLYVLGRMAEDGYITASEAKTSGDEPVQVYVREDYKEFAPFYLETVRLMAIKKLGEVTVLDKGIKIGIKFSTNER